MAEVVRKKLSINKNWNEKSKQEKIGTIIGIGIIIAILLIIIAFNPLIIFLIGFVLSIRFGVLNHWKVKKYESLSEVTEQQEKEYNKYNLIRFGLCILGIICLIFILATQILILPAIGLAVIEYYILKKKYEKFQESDFIKNFNENEVIDIPS